MPIETLGHVEEVALLESTEERNFVGLSYFPELRRPPAPPVDVLSSWKFALEDVSESGHFSGDSVNGPVCGKATEGLCRVCGKSNGTVALGAGVAIEGEGNLSSSSIRRSYSPEVVLDVEIELETIPSSCAASNTF